MRNVRYGKSQVAIFKPVLLLELSVCVCVCVCVSPARTEMSACLSPCLMLFVMEPARWVFKWVQVSSPGVSNTKCPCTDTDTVSDNKIGLQSKAFQQIFIFLFTSLLLLNNISLIWLNLQHWSASLHTCVCLMSPALLPVCSPSTPALHLPH